MQDTTIVLGSYHIVRLIYEEWNEFQFQISLLVRFTKKFNKEDIGHGQKH